MQTGLSGLMREEEEKEGEKEAQRQGWRWGAAIWGKFGGGEGYDPNMPYEIIKELTKTALKKKNEISTVWDKERVFSSFV